MPFARDTLQQIIDRVQSDIEARLPGADARTRRSNLSVIARAVAGLAYEQYGYLDWQARQIIADTADADIFDRHANIWKVPRKTAAPAKGNVTATGTNGATIPAGTVLQRADGVQYTTDAACTIAAGVATVAVTASLGALLSNAVANTTLSLTQPIAGIASTVTVATGGLVGGTDIEALDLWRSRFFARLQRAPHAGTKGDYEAWALEVAGVTRAWCNPLESGVGTATVRFMRDGDASPIPAAGDVSTVQSYLDARKPLGATITVAAPVGVALNFSITLTPNTQAVRDAVTASLADLIRREAAPGATILLSHIREAISIATGETDDILTAPTANVTYTTSQIATMGTITWA